MFAEISLSILSPPLLFSELLHQILCSNDFAQIENIGAHTSFILLLSKILLLFLSQSGSQQAEHPEKFSVGTANMSVARIDFWLPHLNMFFSPFFFSPL